MNKQSGFTLIELVIVIIILGILAATAVPKFVDLQGDARRSAMKGVKGALEGAATLTYSRSAIDGTEKKATHNKDGLDTVYGYPAATQEALTVAAGLSITDWKFTGKDTIVITALGSDDTAAHESSGCNVRYTEANNARRPVIDVVIHGC